LQGFLLALPYDVLLRLAPAGQLLRSPCSAANWIQLKILHRQGLRALPGGELTWRCTFL